ncbi:NAD(P)/FAD-dependent oxidoreductase [Oceaniglobus indicus]|uniref:NAD(P)/FAD-dependent oxidoreductase n=1 Tax=Oceaniglobus indicus TaxID=2047749 RepID=UPI000C19E6B6|nr:NAD(P)/FAD-dependent oxidoreductase [Oceaniglobus indicus]
MGEVDQSATTQAERWVTSFADALERGDVAAVTALFGDECYWRDLVTFTWNIATFEGRDAIADMLRDTLNATAPTDWNVSEAETDADGTVSAWLTFQTATARGEGHVRLRDGRARTLLTAMSELKDHEERRGPRRPKGVSHGVHAGRKTWSETREAEARDLGYRTQPYVVIIGGGQGGLALGARLRQMDVPTIIIEKNARAGDSWRNRYRSLCLHDPVWYDHMPYLPFPDNWPVFTPKDKIGDWLEMYAKVMELNLWTSTEALGASYDDASGEWTLRVRRDGEEVTLNPRHLVLATGLSGMPNIPDFPGRARFRGTQIHSSAHKGGTGWEGKKAVVIGSNNSAHDICAELWEHGADVTMVQRSSTLVIRSETLVDLAMKDLYSEEALAAGITTDRADMTFASLPYALTAGAQTPIYDKAKERDADFYKRLDAAGFKLDFGEDDSGLLLKYLRRGSGYYIDVGASELVAEGKIKVRQGQVSELTETGVKLEDGTELPADLVVYATGYGPMNGWAAQLISQEVADKVGKCWGLGSGTTKDPGPWEGELRNMWKPTAQDGLWFHGGNLHQSRHYSHYLALQLKARMEGIDTPVTGRQPVHHLA